jgi:hypothetical protein
MEMITVPRTDSGRRKAVRRMAENIILRYGQANTEQKIAGERWYITANQLAYAISGGDVIKGAGVLAALSANKSWTENVKLARHAFATGTPAKHVRTQLEKAERIMAGEPPLDVLGGFKTTDFYLCVSDPTHPYAVVVDRHAHDLAVGQIYGNRDRGLSAKSRYDLIADAYRSAAKQLGTLPLVVQAVSWVVQVENHSEWSTRGYSNGRAER